VIWLGILKRIFENLIIYDGKQLHKKDTIYDNNGYDKNGFNEKTKHINGTWYDDDGYNKFGFNKSLVHMNGTYFDGEGIGCDGYNLYGLDKNEYNRGGLDKDGYDRGGYDRFEFNKKGIDRDGFNKNGFDKNKYNSNGCDKNGFNKLGYDTCGFDSAGFDMRGLDKEGFNKEGYSMRGFDRAGFDMQGYSINGGYKKFIDRYIKKNIICMTQDNSKLYRHEIKEIMLNIERAEKSASINDYIASISHLRRAGEFFTNELLRDNGKEEREISQLNQFEKIGIIKQGKYITVIASETLDRLRRDGNSGVHQGKADKIETNRLLGEMKKIVNNWIEVKYTL